MVSERKNARTIAGKEYINQLLRGSGEGEAPSCFIDAMDLQDSSDKKWLLEEDNLKIDYTKFGNMRKIKF